MAKHVAIHMTNLTHTVKQLPEQYGYSLPDFTISAERQQAIVGYMKGLYESGIIKPTGYTSLAYDGEPFIIAMALRNAFKDGVQQPSNMLHRFDDVDWEWDLTHPIVKPMAEIVQDVITPLSFLYKVMTRVVILLQLPNLGIPMHTDYHEHNITGHKLNHHLTLKIPLTDTAGDNGNPLLKIDGNMYRYETGNSPFLLNEVDIEHGSAPVNHTRGVLFIDGLFDFSKFNRLNYELIELENYLS